MSKYYFKSGSYSLMQIYILRFFSASNCVALSWLFCFNFEFKLFRLRSAMGEKWMTWSHFPPWLSRIEQEKKSLFLVQLWLFIKVTLITLPRNWVALVIMKTVQLPYFVNLVCTINSYHRHAASSKMILKWSCNLHCVIVEFFTFLY